MNAISKAIEIIGRDRMAGMFGVTPQAISQWKSSMVPAERCPSIERATSGQVRCEDLRPDIDWAVLRNSDCAEAA
jgi:DNA-binding transcriptional regulator YdaS (Cro superfamily)